MSDGAGSGERDALAAARGALADREADLQAALAAYKAFAYSVSHDLRAPLRAIAGFTGFLEETLPAEVVGEARQFLAIIRDNARLLNDQIDGLLAISRIEHRELQPIAIDVTALAARVVEDVRVQEPTRAVAVHIADVPTVVADYDLVRMALVELVRNAWKFTRARPDARVEIGGAPRDGTVDVFVRDNGVGFPAGTAEGLFVVFRRMHGPQEYEGHGLGLAIVRAAVGRHRGRVWAECDPAIPATTIGFSLPA